MRRSPSRATGCSDGQPGQPAVGRLVERRRRTTASTATWRAPRPPATTASAAVDGSRAARATGHRDRARGSDPAAEPRQHQHQQVGGRARAPAPPARGASRRRTTTSARSRGPRHPPATRCVRRTAGPVRRARRRDRQRHLHRPSSVGADPLWSIDPTPERWCHMAIECPAADGSLAAPDAVPRARRRCASTPRSGTPPRSSTSLGHPGHRARRRRRPADGQQLRVPGPLPLLRRRHLPPDHQGLHVPGRRPHRHRPRRAGLPLRRRAAEARALRDRLGGHGQRRAQHERQPVLRRERRRPGRACRRSTRCSARS